MSSAPALPIIAFESSEAWETWLAENHTQPTGIWMRISKKGTNVPSVTYAEALDVALCYGWIDGQKKIFDDQSWLQKFTPRRARSGWSKVNTQHVDRLTREGRMKPAGLVQMESAKRDGRWENAYPPQSAAEPPEDFIKELNKNEKAKAFFRTLTQRNIFPIVYRLQSAKRPETRRRRMEEIIAMFERGEKFY